MNLKKILKPYLRRMRFESVMQACFAAFAAGGAAALLTLMIMRLVSSVTLWGLLIGISVAAAIIAGILAYILIYRFSYQAVLRRVDGAGLQERLVTMIQLWDDQSYIARAQREDTLARLAALKPRAVSLHIPLITTALAFGLSLTGVVGALVPSWERSATPVSAIEDDYKVYHPVVKELVEELYKKVENLPDDIDPDIKDKLEQIIKDIDQSLNSGEQKDNTDRVSDLEEKLDQINQIIKENQVSKTIGDILMQLENTKELGAALVARDDAMVQAALDNMVPEFTALIQAVIKGINTCEADSVTKNAILACLNTTLNKLEAGDPATGEAYGFSEAKEIIRTYALEPVNALLPDAETSLGALLSAGSATAVLGQAIAAGDAAGALAALQELHQSLASLEGEAKINALDILISDFTGALIATTDSESAPVRAALGNFLTALSNTKNLLEMDEDATQCLSDGFELAASELPTAVLQEKVNNAAVSGAVSSLEAMLEGQKQAEKLAAIATDLATAFQRGNFSESTEIDLIQALAHLMRGLESASASAAQSKNFNTQLEYTLSVAYSEITAALHQEKKNEEALEDVKKEIQDAIDEIMDNEKNADVYVPTDQDKNKDEQNSSQDQNDSQNQSPSGGGSGGGTDDRSDLTFYNPITGRDEQLTEENLREFKERMDREIESGTYTDEQKNELERYYQALLQRFN